MGLPGLTRLQGDKRYGDLRSLSRYSAKNTSVLMPLRTALANRANTPVNIAVIASDSTEEGTGAGSAAADRAKSWPSLLGQIMRARFPTTGETVSAAPNYVPVKGEPGGLPTGWTVSAGWTTGFYGLTAFTAKSTAAGDTLSYTVPVGTSAADLIHVAGSAITGFTVSIDGAAASATQGTTGSTRDGATYRMTFDPSATHTVTITTVGTNNFIDGIALYQGNESKGIRVFNGGHHGSHSDQYVPAGIWSWVRTGQTPATLSGVQALIPLSPDLLIISGGVYNDYQRFGAATWKANVQTILAAARATVPAKPLPAVVLGKWLPGTTWTSGTADTWATFRQARIDLAAADPLTTYLDLMDTMPAVGSSLATATSLYADSVHGNAAAYQMTAESIASFIAP